jgi:hypothetical protein
MALMLGVAAGGISFMRDRVFAVRTRISITLTFTLFD